jgi:hypothetical protein
MRRFGSAIGRVFHSRAGGTLACVLLASMVGGVALASPGAFGGGGPGRAAVEASKASSDAKGGAGRWSEEVAAGSTDSVAGCRLLVARLADELEAGEANGLERAIDVVVRKCGRHEAAGGLTNALERLTRNLERRLAQEAARAERQDERSGNGPGPVRQDGVIGPRASAR